MLTWRGLRALGELKLIRSMYYFLLLVPIAAKALEFIDSKITFTFFGAIIPLHFHLPFSWIVFFFASVAFVIAQVVFQIFAPQIVKDHPSYTHFANEGKSRFQLLDYAKQVGFDPTEYSKFREAAGGAQEPEIKRTEQMFWGITKKAEAYRVAIRSFVAFFYLTGFILMGYVLVENIRYVWFRF